MCVEVICAHACTRTLTLAFKLRLTFTRSPPRPPFSPLPIYLFHVIPSSLLLYSSLFLLFSFSCLHLYPRNFLTLLFFVCLSISISISAFFIVSHGRVSGGRQVRQRCGELRVCVCYASPCGDGAASGEAEPGWESVWVRVWESDGGSVRKQVWLFDIVFVSTSDNVCVKEGEKVEGGGVGCVTWIYLSAHLLQAWKKGRNTNPE